MCTYPCPLVCEGVYAQIFLPSRVLITGLRVFITQVCVVCRGAAAECVPMSGECRRNGDDGN